MAETKEPYFGLSFWLVVLITTVCGFQLAMLLFALGSASILERPAHEPFWFGEHAPVRDVLEIGSFIGNFVIAAVAAIALFVARHQLSESTVLRLATLYASIEQRWSSPEMVKSRGLAAEILFAYGEHRRATGSRTPVEVFADEFLSRLNSDDFTTYTKTMAIADFLEYVGLLHNTGFIRIEHLGRLMGAASLDIYTVFSQHIATLNARTQARGRQAGFNLPPDYRSFTDLAEAFRQLYKA